MKKVYLPLVILLVLAFIVTGCGSSTPTTTAPAQTTTAAPTTSAAKTTTAAPTTAAPTSAAPTTAAPTTKPAATTTAGPAPKKGGVLKYIYGYSPGNNIGWPMETNTQNIWGTNFVYAEPLVAYMIDDTVKPWLATSWEFSSDKKSITFHLRKGVKFQDGTPFNADAVKWQIDMNISLKNAVAANWTSAEVIDDSTVRLNFKTFRNTLWADLTDTRMFFVSPTQYKNNGNSIDYMREHPCGTGPFIFKSWERDVNMIFTRNPNYWDTPKPYLDGIQFITVKDKVTQQSVMQSGDGDMLALLTGRELFDMKNLKFETVAFPAGTDFMVPDTRKPTSILNNKNLRLAMEYAIDKAAVTKALGYGYMVPNWQLPSPPQPYFNKDLPDKSYSIDKAKNLMAQAGYPNGFNTKLYVEGAAYGTKALAIQDQLKKANINAEIVTLENLKFWEYNFNGWPDGLLFAGFSWSPNFARSFNAYFPPNGLFFHDVLVRPEITAMAETAMLATDAASQRQANYDLIKAVYDDEMVVPYLSDAMGWAVAPYVKDHHLILEGADFCSWFPAETWLDK